MENFRRNTLSIVVFDKFSSEVFKCNKATKQVLLDMAAGALLRVSKRRSRTHISVQGEFFVRPVAYATFTFLYTNNMIVAIECAVKDVISCWKLSDAIVVYSSS